MKYVSTNFLLYIHTHNLFKIKFISKCESEKDLYFQLLSRWFLWIRTFEIKKKKKNVFFIYRNKSDVILNGLVGLGKIPSNFLPQLDVTLLFAFRKVDSICFSEPEIRIDIGSNQMKGKTENFSSLLTTFFSWIHFPKAFVMQIQR